MTSVLPPNASASVPTPPTESASSGNEGQRTRFVVIFGIASVVLTLVAVALAVVAPLLSPVAGPLSDGWQKVYDSKSQAFSPSTWDDSKGCDVTPDGLHAHWLGKCIFKPSLNADLTSKGFVIDVTVAPPSAVEAEQRPVIYVSDSVFVEIDQSGAYALCVFVCGTPDPNRNVGESPSGIIVIGQADDWHAQTNVSNSIAVRVTTSETAKTLQFFTNSEYMASIDLSPLSLADVSIALGADDAYGTTNVSEALYTSVAIYSASA